MPESSNDPFTDRDRIDSSEKELWQQLELQYAITERNDVAERLGMEIKDWGRRVSRRLDVENPFFDNFAELESEEQDKTTDLKRIRRSVSSYASLRKKIGSSLDKHWLNRLQEIKSKHDQPIENGADGIDQKGRRGELVGFKRALQRKWREDLEKASAEWQIKQINEYRREIFEKLKSWLDLLQQIYDLLASLAIEPGLLFDLSEGAITNTDMEELKRWTDYIAQDEGVRKLCDMLGRLRRAERRSREEMVKHKTKIEIDVPDINSREEITGIKLGKDIEHAIPAELALMADPDTSLLFDLKYIEGRLLCFDMEGISQQQIEKEEQEMTSVSEEEKMGPMIVCVDTSGSMQGAPETIAKAITLYLATKAASQERKCYLINFSTSIETLDLSDGVGFEKVLQFLKKSFHGGTDAAPALKCAIETAEKDDYQRSDVLTISDFVMGDLPDELHSSIKELRQKKNRFYSLCIGEQFIKGKLKDIFDNEWVYNPHTGGIDNMLDFARQVGEGNA